MGVFACNLNQLNESACGELRELIGGSMSYSGDLPCELAATGGQTGLLGFAVQAVLCLGLGALLVLAARRAETRQSMLQAFGAIVLVGGVVLASGVAAPAAQASDGGKNCVQSVTQPAPKPVDPKPVVCPVLPEGYVAGDSVVMVLQGDVSSFTEDYAYYWLGGWPGFGPDFTVAGGPDLTAWVSAVNSRGGTVELQFDRVEQLLNVDLGNNGYHQWNLDFPGLGVSVTLADTGQFPSENRPSWKELGQVTLDPVLSFADFQALVLDWYAEEHDGEEPAEGDIIFARSGSTLLPANATLRATIPASAGCAAAAVELEVMSPGGV